MKILFVALLFSLIGCRESIPKGEEICLYGTIESIMEDVFEWHHVSYTFAYDAQEISNKTYTICLPKNATLHATIHRIDKAVDETVEINNDIINIYND